MSGLSEVLEQVRQKISLYQGKELNEANTKMALIDPVLRALGWDLGNLEEVLQEYRRQPKDNPVDYAFFLLRTARLFLEAKSLGENLDDPKWAKQIMGYALVAGVKWVVVTNGDEYRIYNSSEAVPIEEKMFGRAVRLSDSTSRAEETLALLSKERITDLEELWRAQVVDRRVLRTLEALFPPDPDPALMRLVKKRAGDLRSGDIRASLARLRVQFDFPVEPKTAPVGNAERKTPSKKPPAAEGKRETRQVVGVPLRDVISAGLLRPPLKLTSHYRGTDFEAELLPDGAVTFRGKMYKTCSGAADFARSTITGRPMSTNGWVFWEYRDQNGNLVPLDTARQEFSKRRAK